MLCQLAFGLCIKFVGVLNVSVNLFIVLSYCLIDVEVFALFHAFNDNNNKYV